QIDIEADFNMASTYGYGYESQATPSGHSFFNYNSTWMNSNYFSDGGDFCIRALTNNSTSVHTPTMKSVENGTKGIKVTWNKVAGASSYTVQRSTNKKNWKNIKTVTKTSYTDTSVKNKNGNTFYYRVVANGERVSGSKGIVRLATPTLTKASNVSRRGIQVNYKKNSKASGYQVQYSLKKNFSSGVKTVKVNGANKVKKVVKGLRKGKVYYVRVRCFKGKNYSGWSATKKVKISK
ncbi:MAG: fibronectin type III domain-containing protein, partial [Agathobacter sp.]|nr:fibronectin type III domain-containing protein [Agathobacter sp.]